MADTPRQDKQMPDTMEMSYFIKKIKYQPAGIKASTKKEPIKSGQRQGCQQGFECYHHQPPHRQINRYGENTIFPLG